MPHQQTKQKKNSVWTGNTHTEKAGSAFDSFWVTECWEEIGEAIWRRGEGAEMEKRRDTERPHLYTVFSFFRIKKKKIATHVTQFFSKLLCNFLFSGRV